ncbi:MAG TPA: hypothetical protein VIV60_30495 [Polyangiaceae bacterium]
MKANHIQTSIEVNVIVEYDFYPGGPGARDSLGGIRGAGPPLEPDEPPSAEVTRVLLGTLDITNALDDDTINDLADKCYEHEMESHREGDYDPPEPEEREF